MVPNFNPSKSRNLEANNIMKHNHITKKSNQPATPKKTKKKNQDNPPNGSCGKIRVKKWNVIKAHTRIIPSGHISAQYHQLKQYVKRQVS